MGVWILAPLLTGSKAFNKIFYSEDSCGESWMSLKISYGFAYMESRQNLTYCSPTMQEILSGMQSKCTLEPVFQNFTVELGEQATHWVFQLHTSLHYKFKIAYVWSVFPSSEHLFHSHNLLRLGFVLKGEPRLLVLISIGTPIPFLISLNLQSSHSEQQVLMPWLMYEYIVSYWLCIKKSHKEPKSTETYTAQQFHNTKGYVSRMELLG